MKIRLRKMCFLPGTGGSEIGQDVAEEVGGHHVEAVRAQDKACRENVDTLSREDNWLMCGYIEHGSCAIKISPPSPPLPSP
jgi:hypothetical protein